MFSELAAITKHVLSIWDSKESRRYLDRVIELEKDRYEELKKPSDEQRHDLLDNIDYELCLISRTATSFGVPKVTN